MLKKIGLLITISCSLIAEVDAVDSRDTTRQSIPIHISIMDESVSLPNFWFTRYSYNPALMIGTEWKLKAVRNHDWHLAGNLGYYHQKDWQTAFFLLPELGYRRRFNRVSLTAKLGAGYLFGFHPRPVYGEKDGGFGEVKNTGYSKFMGSLSLNLGYQLKKTENAPEIYITFMESIELPFREWTGLQQFVGAGYRFYIKK